MEISFPDFLDSPPSFPKTISGGAYLTCRVSTELPAEDEALVHHLNKDCPYIWIDAREPGNTSFVFLYLYNGHSVDLPFTRSSPPPAPKTKSEQASLHFFEFLKQGYRHVIPDGWDHILFILALCLLSLKWKILLKQSLIFTLAHTITLGLSVSGYIAATPSIIEPIIALSISWMAVENFFAEKVSRFRAAMIFTFGLIHGMGFGNMLARKIQASGEFGMALFAANLGVELAQVTIIGVTLLMLGHCTQKPWFTKVTYSLSGLIAIAGLWLFFSRI